MFTDYSYPDAEGYGIIKRISVKANVRKEE